MDNANPEAIYDAQTIENDITINDLYNDMQVARLDLASDDENKFETANYRVGLAVNFISALPYAFAQEGK